MSSAHVPANRLGKTELKYFIPQRTLEVLFSCNPFHFESCRKALADNNIRLDLEIGCVTTRN